MVETMEMKIARWYKQGLWTPEIVQTAVEKRVLSQEQAEKILGK